MSLVRGGTDFAPWPPLPPWTAVRTTLAAAHPGPAPRASPPPADYIDRATDAGSSDLAAALGGLGLGAAADTRAPLRV